jgi:hypothetical protein
LSTVLGTKQPKQIASITTQSMMYSAFICVPRSRQFHFFPLPRLYA